MQTMARARVVSGHRALNRHEGPGAGYREAVSFNEQQHGENPDVFWFKVKVDESSPVRLMRLCFYGGCTVTVFFGEGPG